METTEKEKSVKEQLKELLSTEFDLKVLYVHISDKGVVSFQGTLKTK